MEKKISLHQLSGSKQLWTREKARELRQEIDKALASSGPGDAVVLDIEGIEVFDYSFANELFGKTILSLTHEYKSRFFIVESLSNYTRENLDKALESLNMIMIERKQGNLTLIGKVHPADNQTFDLIKNSTKPVTATELKDKLHINLTAVNERLSKLVQFGVVMRETGISGAGRQHYVYSGPKL
jgi:response regulator of citrate/malate metabolism